MPDPSVPHWSAPRVIARSLTRPGSAPSSRPPASVNVRSRSAPYPRFTTYDEPSSISLTSSGLLNTIPPALADAGGDVAEELVHQGPDPVLDVVPHQIGPEQSDAAVDVVAHAARRDHPPGTELNRGRA